MIQKSVSPVILMSSTVVSVTYIQICVYTEVTELS